VFARQKRLDLRQGQQRGQKRMRDICFHEPVAAR
jgi:hypothetical protein